MPAARYPVRAMACVATHDLPPLAGWWEGEDIREREALGLLGSSVADARQERETERAALVETLEQQGCLSGAVSTDAVVVGAHAFIAQTPSELLLVQADDLSGARIGVNLPGTDRERPNWRRLLPGTVETLFDSAIAQGIMKAVRTSK